MEYFNRLSSAEAERLALLLEECGEVQQVIGKILRHGYESTHPNGGPTNRELLELEIADIHVAGTLLIEAGDIQQGAVEYAAEGKSRKVRQYLHHQAEPTDEALRGSEQWRRGSFTSATS